MIIEGKTDGWLSSPIDTVPAWAAFNSVLFNAIKIGPIPGLEDRGSTIIAKRRLEGGNEDPLMTIPRDLILSLERIQEHAKVDADLRAILERLGEFGRVGLVLLAKHYTFCSCVVSQRIPKADCLSDRSRSNSIIPAHAIFRCLPSDK